MWQGAFIAPWDLAHPQQEDHHSRRDQPPAN